MKNRLLESWLQIEEEQDFLLVLESIIKNPDIEVLCEVNFLTKVMRKLRALFTKGKAVDLKLKSSAIDRLRYDPKTKELIVRFTKNKRVYRYSDVGQKAVAKIIGAGSHGQSYWNHIKYRDKPYQELPRGELPPA